jgi:hypothetical protein
VRRSSDRKKQIPRFARDDSNGDDNVTVDSSKFRYSLTVSPQDTAVLYCLRALWHYAEEHHASPNSAPLAPPGESHMESEGTVTFRFSDPRHRSDFLGEATRLLAGKWMRQGTSDEDPPRA